MTKKTNPTKMCDRCGEESSVHEQRWGEVAGSMSAADGLKNAKGDGFVYLGHGLDMCPRCCGSFRDWWDAR